MFGHPWSPLIALGVVIAGGLIRHFFNITNHGIVTTAAIASIPAAIVVVVVLVMITAYRPGAMVAAGGASFADVHPIIEKHCIQCHSAHPTSRDFPQAPKGVMFDTPDEIRLHAKQIEQQAVLSKIMPLGNLTGMTEAERQNLGAWIEAGASLR
jgi:uncharacterized membrane protein